MAKYRDRIPGPAVADPHAAREAQRYENPIPSREAILAMMEERGEIMSAEDIARGLRLFTDDQINALDKRLGAMVRDGQLLRNRRNAYAPAQKLSLIPGRVIANAEGYGFLRPDEGGDDLYLSPSQMRSVLHGDRVLASVVGIDRRGRRQGAIVEVLERRSPRLVGRVVVENGVTLVEPDDRRLHQNIMIPAGRDAGARSGEIVVVEITEPPTPHRGPLGTIRAVLGERLQPSLVVEMAIASHDLPHEWPPQVVRQAEEVEPKVTAAERKGKVDIRHLPLVTIDGEDARDFDDAVYAEPLKHGGFRLIVAIADVSHYVPVGTPLDAEAYERSTSTYFPGFVVPMLPETLSNGICSLNPKVDRLCMVCDMEVDAEGEVQHAKFYEAVMYSHARLTYTKVWQAVGERNADVREEIADVLPQVENLHKLYKAMAKARKRRGAIDFETPEVKFRLTPSGDVIAMGATDRNDAHKLIEECMIAANVQAAKFLSKRKIPALYRVHAPPPVEKYEDLLQFLREFKLRLPPNDEVTPADFSALLKKVHDRPEAELIQSVLLRAQSMAVYLPTNDGHFGLALDAYAHFTSPIRRYPDLLVHRAIRYALTKGKPADYEYTEGQMEKMAVHCSQRERRAEEAERDVDERFKCAWMEKHVGEEFAGTITGVTSFGLFVELAASRVSGLVHVSQLPNDYYKFDPVRHLLAGERTGAAYRLGDYVSVQVLRASMEDRKIDFRLKARLESLPKVAPPPAIAPPPVMPVGTMAEVGKALGRVVKKVAEKLAGKKPAPKVPATEAVPVKASEPTKLKVARSLPVAPPQATRPAAAKPAVAKKAPVATAQPTTAKKRPMVAKPPVVADHPLPTLPPLPAAKPAVPAKPAAKKAVAKKAAATKPAAAKPAVAKKAAGNHPSAKNAPTKTASSNKPATKKVAASKAAVKKVAPKKAAVKKVAAKKAAPRTNKGKP
ncbi:ribonuclease R [Luteibacter aegosomatissinici]|nr:ribonuclease R [Luteibacter aegosomatissinici]UPG96684.1 ribonuclease R [Luteibacter aegosomatissinici]